MPDVYIWHLTYLPHIASIINTLNIRFFENNRLEAHTSKGGQLTNHLFFKKVVFDPSLQKNYTNKWQRHQL